MHHFKQNVFQLFSVCFFYNLITPTASQIGDIPYYYDEDEFVRLYGNDGAFSGNWKRVREFSSDEGRMKSIALQAHKAAGMLPTQTISSITLGTRTLSFSRPKYKPIPIEVIIYNIPQLPENTLYVSKGLKPECVFYLTRWDRDGQEFRLGIHKCGIIF